MAEKPSPETTDRNPNDMANAIRALTMDAVQKANSGHPGMPMGMADVATVLFQKFISIDPSKPDWPNRDRFVLSAGHGSMLIYAIHHLLGYEDMGIDQIRNFRQLGSRTAGHPEYGHAAGIETTTGPLGQGIATAVGMAIGERLMNARFGDGLVDHYTYVIAGDGCLMEGVSHEAIDLAGTLCLNKLIVLWDDNGISIDGKVEIASKTDQIARFKAAGWNTFQVDGHHSGEIEKVIEEARKSDKPAFIACRTVIGYGSPNKAGTKSAHGEVLGDDEIALTRKELIWESEPFVLPEAVVKGWREVATKGRQAREAWERKLSDHPKRQDFEIFTRGILPVGFSGEMQNFRNALVAEKPKVATRKASEMTLDVVNHVVQTTIGGSADLTGSNNTKTKNITPIEAGDFSGRYIHYGVREHGMSAAMNGLALYGGLIPYGGTFLVFSDYARGAMRLSALMGLRVVYVLTHDSIGLGEDGPTHQPVEHLTMLRATPNTLVFRPCDVIETVEAWEIALTQAHRPSVLALTRQGLPTVRDDVSENMSAKGGYVLREADGTRDVTIMASGSEIEIALKAADGLKAEGLKAAVVSMPCMELFAEQDAAYRASVLGQAPRIAVEAALQMSWDRWLGDKGRFIGMTGFGASAPAPELYEHFGITPKAVIEAARALTA
ncbi:transketolase [Fulvimarina sp. 2208YS6-2-32]|uniref:Transketolase n=1 Tax=Fulvimarina uroteuthidis TaxID=3098149 RepID=A0ABU5I187_9HYPH|nr:transketolase [Fulvimarina sp. 2208YS6-2-32]MDY8107931.1 transketolase [Fulvimarina sp. 2208YS6-2-32]